MINLNEINPTEKYIQEFDRTHRAPLHFAFLKLIHDHPKIVKITQVAMTALAGVAIVAAVTMPPVSIALGVAAGILLLSAACSWLMLKYITCAKHDMAIHTYKEQRCLHPETNEEIGKLYYKGDIPVLELKGARPHSWGYAHGYILAPQISQLKSNFDRMLFAVVPAASQLGTVIEELKKQIPDDYKTELEGLAEGYNKYAEENVLSDRITLEDLIRLHLIPDSKHFHLKPMEKALSKQKKEQRGIVGQLREAAGGACTTILYKDEQHGLIFSRNMDWLPFGKGGSNSLLMHWKRSGIVTIGAPGLIGAVTGWNKNKVCLAMNVCPGKTKQVKGMPAILYNRQILESASNVDGIDRLIEGKDSRPLGAYHLTVADGQGNGKCFSFYNDDRDAKNAPEDQGKPHFIRNLEEGKPLEVLNWRYPAEEGGSFDSPGRHLLLKQYFTLLKIKGLNVLEIMRHALKLSKVNSPITMHAVVMRPQKGEIELNVDNGFAASGAYQHTNMSEFFQEKGG